MASTACNSTCGSRPPASRVANAKFGRTAVAANLRDGNLTVTIGESQAFGGVVKGSFGLAKSAAGAGLKAQLQFADVDLEQCLGGCSAFADSRAKAISVWRSTAPVAASTT